MIEILAENLDNAIVEMGVKAKKKYQGKEYQVWQLSEEEFEKLNSVPDEDWKDDWGMWRSSQGSTMGSPNDEYRINGRLMLAWNDCPALDSDDDDDFSIREYVNLLEYLSFELGVSDPANVCALAIDLAQANGLTMAELFHKCQG